MKLRLAVLSLGLCTAVNAGQIVWDIPTNYSGGTTMPLSNISGYALTVRLDTNLTTNAILFTAFSPGGASTNYVTNLPAVLFNVSAKTVLTNGIVSVESLPGYFNGTPPLAPEHVRVKFE